MRVTDTIAYVGRDLEDAIVLGLVSRDMLPQRVRAGVGREQRHHGLPFGGGPGGQLPGAATTSAFGPVGGPMPWASSRSFNLDSASTPTPAIKTEHGKIAAAFDRLFETLPGGPEP